MNGYVNNMRADGADVVVVTHNSTTTIDGLFAGLARQKDVLGRVVVVDNASSDETVDAVSKRGDLLGIEVTLIRAPNDGFAGGYARAGAALRGGHRPTLCLNPDVELQEGTLAAMLAVLEDHPTVGIVTAPLVLASGEPDPSSERRLPLLGSSMIYSLLGRLTPPSMRYNGTPRATESSNVRFIEATTGALMLVRPELRTASEGIFDTDYWMYGEDLQLCADAKREGWSVAMAPARPSVHLKGTSSGFPRSHRSNVAFHRAMYVYYRKNLDGGPILRCIVWLGVHLRLAVNLLSSSAVTASRRRGLRAQ